jgi:ribulose 1,5-bisphosphate synthetase/thiazole synthase
MKIAAVVINWAAVNPASAAIRVLPAERLTAAVVINAAHEAPRRRACARGGTV